jgi:hypothetical protein
VTFAFDWRAGKKKLRRDRAPGERFARLRFGDYRGLQLREVERSAVLAALAHISHRVPAAVTDPRALATRPGGKSGPEAQRSAAQPGDWTLLKSDGRSRVTAGPTEWGSMVVKEYAAGGLARRLADAFRGSPARRAWLGGHGLRARGIAAATPYAFVERRRFGLPVASATVFEDLRPAAPADRCAPRVASPEQIVDTLARLVTGLHRRGVIHGDLKASHVYLEWRERRLEARLIDLEGVRFRARLRDPERIQALAELNASLPDSIADDLRCRAFARCAAALPFDRGRETALREIVAASLRRTHRWTGAGCAIASRVSRGRERKRGETAAGISG